MSSYAMSSSKFMVFALYMASAITVVLLSKREGVFAIICISLLIMSMMLRSFYERGVAGQVDEKPEPSRPSGFPQAAVQSKLRVDAQEFVPGKNWSGDAHLAGPPASAKEAPGDLGDGGETSSIEERLSFLLRAARAREAGQQSKEAEEMPSRVTRARKVGPHSAEFFLSQNPSASRRSPNTAAPVSLDKVVPLYQQLLAVGGRPSAPPGLLPPCNNDNHVKVEKLVRRLHDLDKEARSLSTKPSSCRRMVAGWREAIRAVKRSRAVALVIAKDAGADTKIQAIMASANEKGIPVLLGLSIAELGQMIVGAQISTSVLVILHVGGAEDLFEEVSGIKAIARDTTAADEGDSSESN